MLLRRICQSVPGNTVGLTTKPVRVFQHFSRMRRLPHARQFGNCKPDTERQVGIATVILKALYSTDGTTSGRFSGRICR
jgi:hypothetical protein